MDTIYAEIIINSEAVQIDRPFTYKVNSKDKDIIQIGHRVKVPFGIGNKKVEGFVIGLKCELEEDIKRIKEIVQILDKDPILSRDDLKLISFLRENYLCKYIDAIRTIIPVGLLSGIKNKTKSVIVFNRELEGRYKNKDNYIELIETVLRQDGLLSKSELINEYGFSSYSINKLIEGGFLSVQEKVDYRFNKREYERSYKKELNPEQKNAVETIINSNKRGFLINGVTGSGKTEVYMNLIEDVLNKGKSAIVLVPEIALTPQMIENFKGRFGRDVSLYHSKLSVGERFDEWYRLKRGDARLVIGARSALFLPVDNLGLIVVDEEHENTYKSEINPKYDTKEVVKFISEIKDCKYIFASATPSISSYYSSLNGDLQLIQMKNRVDNNELPNMEIVDMREELKAKNLSLLSRKLEAEIQNALDRKEQIILFLNRRGFSTFVSCRSCGYVFKCEDCDTSLTYHKNGYLVCHYCGKAQKEVKVCPKCQSKYVKYFGAGTERVEAEVKKKFSDAKILRMDVDTTKGKDSHEKIYNSFKNGEADILIGTQMIAKGLDFKNVTLVGILAADISLNIPDYRAGERTFQIITQVAGRAGRGEKEGRVIVQSYTPDNRILKLALSNDYQGLFNEEIQLRKLMDNPPFTDILVINAACIDEEKLKSFVKNVAKELIESLEDEDAQLLGPVPCIVRKIKENFRWQIIIKGNINKVLRSKIKDRLYELNKNVYNEIRVNIDINPVNMC